MAHPVLTVLLLVPLAITTGPELTGRVSVDVDRGLLRADVCLRDLTPRRAHAFLLNKSLNIREVRTLEGRRLAYRGEHELLGGKLVGEGLRYEAPARPDDTDSTGFCVAYTGAFPTYAAEEERALDFKGLIAVTDGTLRAPEQAKWYPVPYHDSSGSADHEVRYELEIECGDCSAIFLNGAEPAAGPRARVRSSVPRKPVLFVGDYDFERRQGLWFLNGSIEGDGARAFGTEVARIADFYEEALGFPVGEPPVLLAFDRLASGSGFSFASWPTIALGDVRSFGGVLERGPGDEPRLPAGLVGTLSHEMAHYYFGTLRRAEGPLGWLFSETFPEWLSLVYLRDVWGREAFEAEVENHRNRIRRAGRIIPLAEIADPAETDEAHRYAYGPLVLLAMERAFGAEVVRDIARKFLHDSAATSWDYRFFRTAALSAGIAPEAMERFEERCLSRGAEAGCLYDTP